MPYNTGVFRADTGSDPLVPEPVSSEIIQELPNQSAILQRARQVQLSSRTQRMPVLDVLPMAYWVNGTQSDTGLKQTSSMAWKNVSLVVEEIATIVPIPEAYLADADVPIWDEVQPRLVSAIGNLVDGAALFGVNTPNTWPQAIVPGAVAAGNTVADSGTDLTVEIAHVGQMLTEDGYSVDAFIAKPGLNWRLIGLRTAQTGMPIYQPDLQGRPGGSLYGYPLTEVKNGSWDNSQAQLIAGDWDNAILGMRQDISFKLFDQGVITDSSGAVTMNLMQQDAVAMRVTMRVAFAVANPVTELNTNAATRYPFAVVQTGTSSS